MTRALTFAGYVVIAVAIGLHERRTRASGSATFVDALTLVTRSRVGRWALVGGWLWLGWHLFVRVRDR